jgi:hypothetical protein
MSAQRKRRFGDRRDGRFLRTLAPFYKMTPFIMKTRGDASTFFTERLEVTDIDRYLRKKRMDGYPGIGILHLFIAAYVRTVAKLPALNRFCVGQRIYQRDVIEFVMTVKKEMSVSASETSIKVALSPYDTVTDVYSKINVEVDKVKSNTEESSTDAVAAALMRLPRLVLRFVVWLLGCLDYFGVMPQKIVDASPFHGSFIITDLGSIGIPSIFHHLYNFGNMPVFIALGAKSKVNEILPDGEVVEKKYVDYSIVLDERICDGFYYSQCFKSIKYFFKNPEELEVPPETVAEDVE